MEFWNSLLTEKSWNVMQQLKKQKFKFIVIGGWAVYLHARKHKSKDIDIIVPNYTDLELLNKEYYLRKNDRLKKYEIKIEEIDIDIYVPYYSKLSLPVQFILKNIIKIEGFEVVDAEVLLVLKQGAELDRKESIKGQKDRIDILTLLCSASVNFEKYRKIIEENKLVNYRKRLKEIVQTFKDIKHLDLNVKEYAEIKRKLIKQI